MNPLFSALSQTWPARAVQSLYEAAKHPGEVYAGRADPMDVEKATDLAGLAMTGGLGGLGGMSKQGVVGSGPIKAYHGSPHDFDRFDLSKIGTGEGAQAYGHGLYFAEREAVARDYRNRLAKSDAPSTYTWQGKEYAGRSGPEAHAISLAYHDAPTTARRIAKEGLAAAKKGEPWAIEMGGPDYWTKMNEVASGIRSKKDIGHAQGRMYEVAIHADPERFLDWDAPLKGQSGPVQEIVNNVRKADPDRSASAWYTDVGLGTRARARDIQPAASAALHEAGIPGIKYLDQGSRGPAVTYDVGSPRSDFGPYSHYTNLADAEKQLETLRRYGLKDAEIKSTKTPQSSNYVTFSDNIVEILRKYGLVGGLGGLGGMQAMQEPRT